MPENNGFKFDSKIRKIGNSYYALIPKDLVDHLGLRDGHNAEMQLEEGQHGQYWSTWVPALQQDTEN